MESMDWSSRSTKRLLSRLTRCNLCLEEVKRLKWLSCQHSLCVPCVKLSENLKRKLLCCLICNKKTLIPNTGLEGIPNSTVAEQLLVYMDTAQPLIYEKELVHSDTPKEELLEDQQSSSDDEEDVLDIIVIADSKKTTVSPSDSDNITEQLVIVLPDAASSQLKDKSSVDKNSKCKECSEENDKAKRALANAGLTDGMDLEDLRQRRKLIKRVNEAVKASKDWLTTSDKLVDVDRKYATMTSEIDRARQAILEYQLAIELLCKAKLDTLDRAENVRKVEYQNFKIKISTHAGKISKELSENLAMWERLKTATRQREYELMEICDLKSAEEFTIHLEDMNSERPFVPLSDEFHAGDSVQISFGHDEEWIRELMKTKVTYESIGIVHKVKRVGTHKMCTVLFPERVSWTVRPDFLERSYKRSSLPYIGDTVRLKSPSNNPRNINKLRNGDLRGGARIKIDPFITCNGKTGVLRKIGHSKADGDFTVYVDFRLWEKKYETYYSSIEKVPGCGFKRWDGVRINSTIKRPSGGWRGSHPSIYGIVRSVDHGNAINGIKVLWGDGWNDLCIECRKRKTMWCCKPSDIELSFLPRVGDRVQIKFDVEKPFLDWAGITHEDVGELMKMNIRDPECGTDRRLALVKFRQRKTLWPCLYKELERVRYQYYSDDDGDDDDHSSVRLEGDPERDDVIWEMSGSDWSDDSF